MGSEIVEVLYEQWQRLVAEYFRVRQQARENRLSFDQLSQLDLTYRLRIDLAFTELKIAESLEQLNENVQRADRAH